jgi:hypothetical protein
LALEERMLEVISTTADRVSHTYGVVLDQAPGG